MRYSKHGGSLFKFAEVFECLTSWTRCRSGLAVRTVFANAGNVCSAPYRVAALGCILSVGQAKATGSSLLPSDTQGLQWWQAVPEVLRASWRNYGCENSCAGAGQNALVLCLTQVKEMLSTTDTVGMALRTTEALMTTALERGTLRVLKKVRRILRTPGKSMGELNQVL